MKFSVIVIKKGDNCASGMVIAENPGDALTQLMKDRNLTMGDINTIYVTNINV